VDRIISVTGLSLSTMPEFVSGIVLIVIFAIGLKVLPTGQRPRGASIVTQVRYLLLPVIPLVFVLFGYIARMARAGTIEALALGLCPHGNAEGTASPDGHPAPRAPQLAAATITVIATQTGYLIGASSWWRRCSTTPASGG